MELNEALDVVQQVKGRYRAFEKLEEVLQTVAGMQSSLDSAKRQLPVLQAQVDNKASELAELDAAHTAKVNDHAQAMDAAEQAHKKRLVEMEEEASEKERGLNAHIEELGGRLELEIESLQEDKRNLQDEVTGLQQAKEELETALQELKARFT